MTNTAASSPLDAVDVLHQVESLRHQIRSLLKAFWFPLTAAVTGAATLTTGLVVGLGSRRPA